MELRLSNGDYVSDGKGGLVRLEGTAALGQRVLFRLCARRGAFPLMPTMGSRLYRLGKERPGDLAMAARAYVEEALAEERSVAVEAVDVQSAGDGRLLLTVALVHGGEGLEVKVEV